jgi:hypothetical protein
VKITRTCLPPLPLIFLFLALFWGWLGHPMVANAQDSITELRVITGSSNVQPPAGFTRINVDLNRNAGGTYIYLCYKKGLGTPITGLFVTLDYWSPPTVPVFTRINVDLNQGAGGDYIYLWYTKDPGCTTITDLVVIYGGNAGIHPPAGYIKINADLNHDAGGDYIYLCYKEQ